MSYTDTTENLELPIYVASDKPSYLGDWNEAMNKLDTGYGTVETIKQNVEALETNVSEINTEIEGIKTSISEETTARENGDQQLQTEITTQVGNINTTINGLESEISEVKNDVASHRVWVDVDFTLEENISAVFSKPGEIRINKEIGLMYLAIVLNVDAALSGSTNAIFKINGYETGLSSNHQYIGAAIIKRGSENIYANAYIAPDGTVGCYRALNADDNVYFMTTLPVDELGGDFEPDENTVTRRNAVCNIIKGWQGQFTYSQDYPERLDPVTSGKTDCSGLVYAAYLNAVKMPIASTGTPQMFGGADIASALPHAPLDTSELQPGDIIGFSDNNGQDYTHVVVYTGNGECWEMNEWSAGKNAGLRGPQSIDYSDKGDTIHDLAHYRMTNYRKAVRYIF